jgi:dihydrodipicolinate synthase/N-acetylneuraminate lyase
VNVKAPAIFYPDRYMSSCRELARELRTKRLRVQEEIQQLEALMTRYTTPQNVKGNLTIKELLAKAAAATSVALSTTQANETDLIETETSTEKADRIAKELLAISDRIDSKLKGIVQAIEEIRSPSANH